MPINKTPQFFQMLDAGNPAGQPEAMPDGLEEAGAQALEMTHQYMAANGPLRPDHYPPKATMTKAELAAWKLSQNPTPPEASRLDKIENTLAQLTQVLGQLAPSLVPPPPVQEVVSLPLSSSTPTFPSFSADVDQLPEVEKAVEVENLVDEQAEKLMAITKTKGLKAFRKIIAPIHPSLKYTSWPQDFQETFLEAFNEMSHDESAYVGIRDQVISHQGGLSISDEKISTFAALLIGCVAFVTAAAKMATK